MNGVHTIMYNASRSYLSGLMIIIIFFQMFMYMFKILTLRKITIILTTFGNNTDNVHVNDLVTTIFFENAIYTAVKNQ